MKRLSILFVFALIVSMPFISSAADKSIKHEMFKADLSGLSTPPVATAATGEAVFDFEKAVTGAGPGGLSSPDAMSSTGTSEPGNDLGMSGPGQGYGQDQNRSYSGIIDKDKRFDESGAGAGGVSTKGDRLDYTLNVKDIKNVTAAHLHMGKGIASEGPVVAPLYLGPKRAGEFSGVLASGSITDKDLTGPLAGKTVDDLARLIKSGDVYVNVHTDKHPAGEISGVVKPIS